MSTVETCPEDEEFMYTRVHGARPRPREDRPFVDKRRRSVSSTLVNIDIDIML